MTGAGGIGPATTRITERRYIEITRAVPWDGGDHLIKVRFDVRALAVGVSCDDHAAAQVPHLHSLCQAYNLLLAEGRATAQLAADLCKAPRDNLAARLVGALIGAEIAAADVVPALLRTDDRESKDRGETEL